MNYRDLQNCAAVLLELLEAQLGGRNAGAETEETAFAGTGGQRGTATFAGFAGRRETEETVRGAENTLRRGAGLNLPTGMESTAEMLHLPAGENSVRRQLTEVQPQAETAAVTRKPTADDGREPEITMETIDRFFRRDSRRYDNGFWENG